MVKLPKGEDFNDWLAVHVVDFFNRINLIYGTVCEQVHCTDIDRKFDRAAPLVTGPSGPIFFCYGNWLSSEENKLEIY